MLRNLLYGLSIASIVMIADQTLKWWVVAQFTSPVRIIHITSYFNLVLTYNSGVSFGLLANDSFIGRLALIVITSAISCLLIWWLSVAKTRLSMISLGVILGGAFGNIFDRIAIGAVVDFIDLHAFHHHWPAFNLADAAICVGASLIILESFFQKNEPH